MYARISSRLVSCSSRISRLPSAVNTSANMSASLAAQAAWMRIATVSAAHSSASVYPR